MVAPHQAFPDVRSQNRLEVKNINPSCSLLNSILNKIGIQHNLSKSLNHSAAAERH